MESVNRSFACVSLVCQVLLGEDAVARDKTEWGRSLCILGLDVEPSDEGLRCKPSVKKVADWCRRIDEAIHHDRLRPGDASKLAGALSWGASHMFHRVGRAMLRPVFDQATRRDGAMNPELRAALCWWKDLLQRGICELRPWTVVKDSIVHLYVDASGEKAYMGAVLLIDGQCLFTHAPLEDRFMAHFRRRRDRQIMGLELASR